jgi:hypothetical protein
MRPGCNKQGHHAPAVYVIEPPKAEAAQPDAVSPTIPKPFAQNSNTAGELFKEKPLGASRGLRREGISGGVSQVGFDLMGL